MPKCPADMMDAVSDNMKERTGRSLEEWVALVQASGLDALDQNSVRKWLKSEHGVLQNSQWAIADAAARAAGWERPSVEGYIDSQYTGAKAALRPIFEAIREFVMSLGEDISIEGRGTYTPFVRKRQFATAMAAKDRLDLGLRYKDLPADPRLEATNRVGQATHKLSLYSPADLNDGVKALIRAAYEQNG